MRLGRRPPTKRRGQNKRGTGGGDTKKKNGADSSTTGTTSTASGVGIVGRSIDTDLMTVYFIPVIEKIAIDRMEQYATQWSMYQQNQNQNQIQQQEVDNETTITITTKEEELVEKPIVPLLYYSERSYNEFKMEVLLSTSEYFFPPIVTTSSSSKKKEPSSSSSTNYSEWKMKVNAAKFERLLNERYGMFRPFITKYPMIDKTIRSIQRKYNTGYYSPFRTTTTIPISKTNSIILLFMFYRSQKISITAIILLFLFLLIGLQPWALVGCIVLFQLLKYRKQNRTVGSMKKKIPNISSYYDDDNKNTMNQNEKEQQQQEKQRKYEYLNQPIGITLQEYESSLSKAKEKNTTTNNNNNNNITDTSHYDIIMIGSGSDTLYTAALLARAGRKVLVLSPMEDASGCLTFTTTTATTKTPTMTTTPSSSSSSQVELQEILQKLSFDIDNHMISKIHKQQRLLVPALCTKTDVQGGIRFHLIGCETTGFAYEMYDIPGLMGTTNTTNTSTTNSTADTTGTTTNATSSSSNPFVLCTKDGLFTFMDQTATLLGDGWPDYNNSMMTGTTTGSGIGQSLSGAYIQGCEVLNQSSSSYYVSKILPESVNEFLTNIQSKKTTPYQDCSHRAVEPFLNKVFPYNVQTRSLLAGIGMKMEHIKPCHTSLAAHVTNVCASFSPKEGGDNNNNNNDNEGYHYPIGGPRALCHAFTNVIEQYGGKVIRNVQTTELLFEMDPNNTTTTKTKTTTSTSTTSNEKNDNDTNQSLPQAPRCVGVKLLDGREIRFDPVRFRSNKNKNIPVVISMEGFIHTFIRFMSDDIRCQYKVPRGLPALAERRPVFHFLFALRGNAQTLQLGSGCDYYRLPAASVPYDEIDPITGETKFGIIGSNTKDDEDNDNIIENEKDHHDHDEKNNVNKEDSTDTGGVPSSTTTTTTTMKKTKRIPTKFQSGFSWMRITFPSAKDPSFSLRYGDTISTAIVTIEADDDFVIGYQTKPKIYVIPKSTTTSTSTVLSGNVQRLQERVKKDLLDLYPQLNGNILHSEIRGPFYKGLRHNVERYMAKGIRPETPYPGLYVGGTDLTVDSTSGAFVAGWLVANSVMKYQAIDHLFLSKNITSDIEKFLEPPVAIGVDGNEDLAVPLDDDPIVENDHQEEKEEEEEETEEKKTR